MEIHKCKWMVLGALGCMNNADLEKKRSKLPHCASCVCYLSEIMTCTSDLKNIVLIYLLGNPPKCPQFPVGTLF